ncbi:hypothetical protein WN48_07158 [Eufriesea mexicana]|uniref:Endonuclease/exonuclease/phosphatase domain-containing protein n=1 Tax=Eufriesea mexicana TaxID=516756 RepID=A0A310SWE2_9HYME|nr:hypothetical protein WN48_07158 [Eufriesea mexicana]
MPLNSQHGGVVLFRPTYGQTFADVVRTLRTVNDNDNRLVAKSIIKTKDGSVLVRTKCDGRSQNDVNKLGGGGAASRIKAHGKGEDYVWVKVAGVTYISVYHTPNCSAAEFEQKVAALEDALRDTSGDVILAGDVNARAIERGMTTTNKRRRLLLEMAARLDLTAANERRVTTYRRPGYGASIPDVIFVTDGLRPRVERTCLIGKTVPPPVALNLKKLDMNKVTVQLDSERDPATMIPRCVVGRERAERLEEKTAVLLKRLCDASMPKKQTRRNKRSVYWWTEEIAGLRSECLRLRRRAQRARHQAVAGGLTEEYRAARQRLMHAINDNKKECLTELINEVD